MASISPEHTKEVFIALGDTPAERLLKESKVTRPGICLRFAEYPVIIKAFAPMVREQAFDIGELSLVTFLQALEAGKPLRLLPVVINGSMHHGNIFYDAAGGPLTPADLGGRRVGVRSYTQTMGMWLRGVLKEQYGVPIDEVTWVCSEAPHVTEYRCPPNVELREGADLSELLVTGDICAVMALAANVRAAGRTPLLPDAENAATAWYLKHRTVMTNHMVVVNEERMREKPSAVQAVYDMLREATNKTADARKNSGLSAVGYGEKQIWNSGAIQLAMQYSLEQKLLSRVFDRSEIFARVAE